MINIKKIENTSQWEEFISKQEYTPFVQSPNYGSFYEKLGEKFWIFGIFENNKLIGGSVVVSTHAKRGNFLYLPYGPILEKFSVEHLTNFLNFLKKFASDNNFDFIKVSPFIEANQEYNKVLKKIGLKQSPMHVLAEHTVLIDLKKDDDDLLKNMKKNHRNLIRRCERDGVTVKMTKDTAALNRFNKLHDETARKHGFARFSRKYIEKEFLSFSENNQAIIFEAYLPDGTLDASSIVMFYGNMACYRHSASLGNDKRLPTSYAIQWHIIQESKKRGLKWYNLWGIAPEDASKKHPFHGITHFKKGFGGNIYEVLACHDLPVTTKYWFNWLIEIIRKKKRGF